MNDDTSDHQKRTRQKRRYLLIDDEKLVNAKRHATLSVIACNLSFFFLIDTLGGGEKVSVSM